MPNTSSKSAGYWADASIYWRRRVRSEGGFVLVAAVNKVLLSLLIGCFFQVVRIHGSPICVGQVGQFDGVVIENFVCALIKTCFDAKIGFETGLFDLGWRLW